MGDFYKRRGGRTARCRRCILQERRQRYAADPELYLERVRSYQARRKAAGYRPTKRTFAGVQQADRRKYIKRAYGITPDEFDDILAKQGGRCPICSQDDPGRYWCIDHDHLTGVVRGILCWHCNVGLGHFRDDVEALLTAVSYLLGSQEEAGNHATEADPLGGHRAGRASSA